MKQFILIAVLLVLVSSCAKESDANKMVSAARNDDLAEFAKIVASGYTNLNSQESGMTGATPLTAATLANGTNLFFYLLSAGARTDARNRGGDTPLMTAVMLGDVNLIKTEALIAAGADVNARNRNASVLTYAKWAATGGHVATNTIKLLEKHGAKERSTHRGSSSGFP